MLPIMIPLEWGRPGDYPDDPDERQMRDLILRLLLVWTDRARRMGILIHLACPGELGYALDWIAERTPRVLELREAHLARDPAEEGRPPTSAIPRGYSLTGLDPPEKLREVWEECNLLDLKLAGYEDLAMSTAWRREMGEAGPASED